MPAATATAAIIAHENVLKRLSADPPAGQPQVPFAAWPTETFITKRREFLFNGEAVQIIHEPNAHTDGDSVVFFRKSDVLATGDLFTTVMYPFIDVANGGTIDGYINALNAIMDITVAEQRERRRHDGHSRPRPRCPTSRMSSSTATWSRSSATGSRSTSSAA